MQPPPEFVCGLYLVLWQLLDNSIFTPPQNEPIHTPSTETDRVETIISVYNQAYHCVCLDGVERFGGRLWQALKHTPTTFALGVYQNCYIICSCNNWLVMSFDMINTQNAQEIQLVVNTWIQKGYTLVEVKVSEQQFTANLFWPIDPNEGSTIPLGPIDPNITLYENTYQCVNISSRQIFRIWDVLYENPQTCVLAVLDEKLRILCACSETSGYSFTLIRNGDQQDAQAQVALYRQNGYTLVQLEKIDEETLIANPFFPHTKLPITLYGNTYSCVQISSTQVQQIWQALRRMKTQKTCALVVVGNTLHLYGVALQGEVYFTSTGSVDVKDAQKRVDLCINVGYTLVELEHVKGDETLIATPFPIDPNKRSTIPLVPIDPNITLYGKPYTCVKISSKQTFQIWEALKKNPKTCVLAVVDEKLRLYAVDETSRFSPTSILNGDKQEAQAQVAKRIKEGYQLVELKIDDQQFTAHPFPTSERVDSASLCSEAS